MNAEDVRVVLVTAPSRDTAVELATRVVEEELAACGNVVDGVTSVFRWEGSVQTESEALLILKTTRGRVPALTDRVVELHPYDVPEVVTLPVGEGHAPYLEWVGASVGEGS